MKENKLVTCHYCGKEAELVTGKDIYPTRKDLWNKNFWRCLPCKAYVGCHAKNKKYNHSGKEPLGILANAALRHFKREAHAVFDKIWKEKKMSRKDAYKWLAHKLNIPKEECHIGYFDNKTILKAIKICKEMKLDEIEC